MDEVVADVEQYRCDLVEITGGEPLLQEDVYPLMDRLLASGATVLLETGGHASVARVPAAVVKVMDIKCPGSGECHRNAWDNFSRLTDRDQVKFVIADRVDYEFAQDVVRRHALETRCGAVLFSAVHDVLPPARLAEWVLDDRLPVRLQIQLHKTSVGRRDTGGLTMLRLTQTIVGAVSLDRFSYSPTTRGLDITRGCRRTRSRR